MLIDFDEGDGMSAGVKERREDARQMSGQEEVKTLAPEVVIKDRPVVGKRAKELEEEVKGAVKERMSITKQLRLKKHGSGAKKEEDVVPNSYGASSISNLDGGLMPSVLFSTMQSFNTPGGLSNSG